MSDLQLSNTNQQVGSVITTPEPTGMEELGQEFFSIPRWRIVQPSSKFEGAGKHGGEFQRNIDGVYRESLDVVFIKAQPSNILFNDAAAAAPECVSTDNRKGSLPRADGYYGACGSCGFNRYGSSPLSAALDAKLNAKQPAKHCKTGGGSFVLLTLDDMQPALLGAYSFSIKDLKTIVKTLKMEQKPIWAVKVTLTTDEKTNPSGRFYVMHAAITGEFDAAERRVWAEWYQRIQSMTMQEAEVAPESSSDVLPDDLPF